MATKKNQGFWAGSSNVRNRFKVFRIIIWIILLLISAIGVVMCTGSMEDVVEGHTNLKERLQVNLQKQTQKQMLTTSIQAKRDIHLQDLTFL